MSRTAEVFSRKYKSAQAEVSVGSVDEFIFCIKILEFVFKLISFILISLPPIELPAIGAPVR